MLFKTTLILFLGLLVVLITTVTYDIKSINGTKVDKDWSSWWWRRLRDYSLIFVAWLAFLVIIS